MEPTARLKQAALGLGFDLVGVAAAQPTRETRFFSEWVGRGYAGTMAWLPRRAAEREDPRRVLPGARAVVSVGLVYDPGDAPPAEGHASGRVARYAGGEDYHRVLRDGLESLRSALEALYDEPVATRVYVDTGPVLERVYAARAGLGWIGKNTCLIHPQLGSYVFLGVLLTDAPLRPDAPEPDHCGSCRACLDACPTDAFPEPYVMDASRCLSYTTIELREAIPEPLRAAQGDWVFGCDICQEVCPWNTRAGRRVPPDAGGLRARLAPPALWRRPGLAWLLGLDEEAFRASTRRTALRRARFRGLLRNALIAAGNSGDPVLAPAVQRHAEGPDPWLAEHARWALARLSRGAAPAGAPAPPGADPA